MAKHTLRNAALPIVTITGLQFGTLLGGAVVTETVFAWPGIGRLAIQSIYNRDYPVVQCDGLHRRRALHRDQPRARPAVRHPRPARARVMETAGVSADTITMALPAAAAARRPRVPKALYAAGLFVAFLVAVAIAAPLAGPARPGARLAARRG